MTIFYYQNSFSNEILKVFEFNDDEFKKLEVRKIKKKGDELSQFDVAFRTSFNSTKVAGKFTLD